jgi:hypothetical protein
MLPLLLILPLLFSAVIGLGARRADLKTDDGVYHLYFATRPIDSALMIRAKYVAITKGIFLTWGMTFVVALLWLSKPATDGVATRPTWAFLWERTAKMDLVYMGAVLVLLVACSWRNQVIGAFVDYIPDRFVSRVYPIVITLLGAIYFVVFSTTRHIGPIGDNPSGLLAGLAFLLAIKLAVTAFAGYRLMKLRPLEKSYLTRVLSVWPCYAAVVAALMCWMVGYMSRDLEVKPVHFAPTVLVLIALLLTPLSRMMVARYALENGRHRS